MGTISFARDLVKQINDDATHIMEDGLNVSESSGTIDTGSLALNAALAADLFGGVQDNKITAFAGEESTGKTFLVLAIAYAFQQAHKDSIVVFYDSEAAVTKTMMQERGIDTSRVIIAEMATIQEFKNHLLTLLAKYREANKNADRPRLLVILDSLGQLASLKEVGDSKEGKEVVDMTKAKAIRSTFRVLQLELARSYVPLLVTNHIYFSIMPGKTPIEMGGGMGLKYAASSIILLTKKKDKAADGEVVGNIVTATIKKSRFTREGKKVSLRISHNQGLDRYYGLSELAEKAEIIKKVGNKFEFPNGDKAFPKELATNPEKYWTKDVLDSLNKYVKDTFSYGAGDDDFGGDTDEEEE